MILTLLAFAPLVLILIAAICDGRSMLIPNWISIALIALYFPAALLGGYSPAAIGLHVGFAVAVFAVCAGAFYMGLFGGGDAKLIPAIALWYGFPNGFVFLVFMTAFGGVLAVALVLARRLAPSPAGPAWLKRMLTPGEGVPYGLAIAAGAFASWGYVPVVQWVGHLQGFPSLTMP